MKISPVLFLTMCGFLIGSGVSLAAESPEKPETVEPFVIESLEPAPSTAEAIPEPGTFGAFCVGIAAVIYARRWRRRP